MVLYHATNQIGYDSIMQSGLIIPGSDGFIYFTDTVEHAIPFIAIRDLNATIYIFEVDIPDESKLEESFDHNKNFFKCDAWTYPEDIGTEYITNVFRSDPKNST